MIPAYKYTEITSKNGNTSFITERKTFNTFGKIGKRPIKTKAKIFQKFLGITALSVGIAELVAGYKGFIDEGGLFLIVLPVGLYLVFKRELVI